MEFDCPAGCSVRSGELLRLLPPTAGVRVDDDRSAMDRPTDLSLLTHGR